jgi:hypothetical protein
MILYIVVYWLLALILYLLSLAGLKFEYRIDRDAGARDGHVTTLREPQLCNLFVSPLLILYPKPCQKPGLLHHRHGR